MIQIYNSFDNSLNKDCTQEPSLMNISLNKNEHDNSQFKDAVRVFLKSKISEHIIKKNKKQIILDATEYDKERIHMNKFKYKRCVQETFLKNPTHYNFLPIKCKLENNKPKKTVILH